MTLLRPGASVLLTMTYFPFFQLCGIGLEMNRRMYGLFKKHHSSRHESDRKVLGKPVLNIACQTL